MGSILGFRPPHFSEEEAWLPTWLQPSTIREVCNQAFECPSGQGLEEIGRLQQSISTRENGNLSDDGGCKSFHLFLSGEDNSPMNFPSCSINHEVQYHLRLSLNEESQYSLNQTLSRSQSQKFEFNQALPEAKVIPEEDKAYIFPSQQRGNLGPESLSFKEVNPNPKLDARSRKDDVSDAIELAVAASEALTIYEVVKDERLIASAVLEAAIRVKQARLEDSIETFNSSIEESNEVDFDFLSDLDELTMEDAYEDVGLTVTGHGDLSGYGSISHVNDSFASENYISNAKHKCNKRGSLEVDSGFISPKQRYKQVNNVDYEALGKENANLACDVDPVFNCSVEQADLCTKKVGLQREGVASGDLTSSKSILKSNEREDKMTNLIPDRFQSRWFGGWTWKTEASIPPVINDKYKRSIPELFANETSSISESADIAPDMNSCMQRQDNESKIVSQSSVAPQCKCTYEKANGNLISDDVVVSPSVSPMDPLCSVVPCSFTSDTVVSQNTKHQLNLKKHLGPTAEPNLDNLKVNGDSCPTIRRQVASLGTYSMLYPGCDPYLGKQHTHGESSPFQHNQTPKGDTELTSQREKEINLPDGNTCREENPEQAVVLESGIKSYLVPKRKRVRFSETEISYPRVKKFQQTPQARLKVPLVASRICRRLRSSNLQPESSPHEVKKSRVTDNKMLFQDLKFLLTGFSVKKHKQIKSLIQKNGGIVFDDIPSPSKSSRKRCSKLPIILCPKRLLTTKFLYGCAVNACILKVKWLFDSVDECLILPPKKYEVLKDHIESCDIIGKSVRCDNYFIFDNIAIMLHGKHDFCTKMAKVIKHGGGLVFKTFHWLVKSLDSKKVSVGLIVLEDENGSSRQLKQCALEQKIPIMPFNWIINSLYAGRLLPSQKFKLPDHLIHVEWSQEI